MQRWRFSLYNESFLFYFYSSLIQNLYCIPVLQGLMEVRSPYLEELLSLLMTASTQNGTAGPVATVISLLLLETEEKAVKKEVDSNK